MLALRLAVRELRGSAGGFVVLLVGIAFGTAAIAAIGLLSAAVLDGMRDGARASIGGDVSLRLFHRRPAPEHLAAFEAAGTVGLTAEMRTLARRDGRAALVELKAVEDAYPLYGAFRLDPPLAPADALGRRDGIWGAAVAEGLLAALDAEIGDTVTVDEHRFELRALIADEPDRALRAFTLGPRMIVALPALAGSELVAPGAQVYWYSRIRLHDGVDAGAWVATFERAMPHAGFRIVDASQGVPGAERTLALVSSLLTFVAMGILLVGCVGVANGVSAWLDRKRNNIAILKSLGAQSPLILRIYLAQVGSAAAVGVALGLAGGSAAFSIVAPILGEWLPVAVSLRAGPLLTAGGFGFLVTLLFSLWPLAQAEVQRPQALFRRDLAQEPAQPRTSRLVALAALAVALAVLLVWSAPLPVIAALFVAAAALVVAAFLVLGRLVVIAARVTRRMSVLQGRPVLRLALANMHRPGAPTVPLVMAVGLCLTLIVAVESVRENANRHLVATLPASAPGLVVLNIIPGEGGRFDAFMAASPRVARWERAPFLHARVTGIGDRAVADLHIPADVAFVIRGDRGISWRAGPPVDGLVAGEWWPEDYAGPPLVSLDERAARRLGVGLGDTLTLDVLGAPLRGRIASLRRVDRAGLDLDFPILLSPFAEPPPHREIAAVWTALSTRPEAARDLRAELSRSFPEAPSVLVAEVTAFLETVISGAGRALGGMSAATGVAAFLVLTGAVAASRRRRLREAILLRVVGATRRQVLAATAIEFALIGLMAALAALVLGNLAAWASIASLIDFRPAFAAVLPWLASALVLPATTGLVAAWWALSRPSGEMLRQR
ncbi:MAG: FtsX-like permease family protein [Alphaproteobacteria bacterium]|nr:FtsX-like permease family protein [Alphaproteobacteria bacterium]